RNSVEFFGQKPVKILKDPKYSFFSLIPLDCYLEGVTIRGAKYPLEDAQVSRSNILTVSNEFLENEVEISVKKGKWLLVRSGD
ncbi:MAG: thiamine diphosphokinase, partial [Butyricicoccus sp.]